MPDTLVQMSKEELARIVSNAVEEKLVEMFGDPDEGLPMKENLRKRLRQQRKSVAKGEPGTELTSVRKHLGL